MFPEDILSDEAKNELNKIKEIEENVDREKSIEQKNINIVLKLFME